jgi:hypothetical protein
VVAKLDRLSRQADLKMLLNIMDAGTLVSRCLDLPDMDTTTATGTLGLCRSWAVHGRVP